MSHSKISQQSATHNRGDSLGDSQPIFGDCVDSDNGNNKAEHRRFSRRQVLKGSGFCAASVTAALVTPGLAAAASKHLNNTQTVVGQTSSDTLPLMSADGISVEFSDPAANHVDGLLARVSISNNSQEEIELRHLSPGAITTKQGVYNLNARLAKSPISVGPNGVYHLWLSPQQEPETASFNSSTGKQQRMVPVTIVRGDQDLIASRHTRLSHAVFS